jgi:hypothetical protein
VGKIRDRLWVHGLILRAVPFSWVIPLAIGLALGLQDQGQDLLQQFVEWERAPNMVHRILPWLGILLLGGTAWYSSRILLGRPLDRGGLKLPQEQEDLRKWYPRMLGALTPLVIAGALFRAAYFAGADGGWLGWAALLAPVILGAGVLRWIQRHEDLLAAKPWLGVAGVTGVVLIFAIGMLLGLPDGPSRRLLLLGGVSCGLAVLLFVFFIWRRTRILDDQGRCLDHTPRALSRTSVHLILGLLGLCWLVGAAITVAPVAVAPPLGSVFLVLLVGAVWTAVGAAAMLLRTTFRVPVLGVVILWLVVASFFNDYHVVRGVGEWPTADPVSLEDRFARWDGVAESSAESIEDATANPAPVFLVVGEGGGVRAAYWTASVLASLQESDARFVDRVFALSTVSGSSLGAAVFMALTEEGDVRGCGGLVSCTDSILAQDFLSPLLGMMLTSDVAGKLFPFPFLDRSLGIEAAFEQAWSGAVGNDRFSRGLTEALPDRPARPILYMNSTRVETGTQMVMGTAPWLGSSVGEGRDLRDVLRAPPSLAGAVHNSARFPMASPAGRVDTASGGPSWRPSAGTWGRLADGGYYEVSGGATALDLARVLCAARNDVCGARLHVIAILNGPDRGAPAPDRAVTELMSPVVTLFRAREARARESLEALESLVGPDRFHALRLCPNIDGRRANLPLGWHLSQRAQSDMKKNLTLRSNRGQLDAIVSALRSPLRPGSPADSASATGTPPGSSGAHRAC